MTAMLFSFAVMLTFLLFFDNIADSAQVQASSVNEQATTKGQILAFGPITFAVGNALQAAYYWCVNFGFLPIAYSGLETSNRDAATHVISQGNITIIFEAVLEPESKRQDIWHHVSVHGDAIKDIGLIVDDVDALYAKVISAGVKPVRAPWTAQDANGQVRMATVEFVEDITHTFYDRSDYKGAFLPGFGDALLSDVLLKQLPPVGLNNLDFFGVVVGNKRPQSFIDSYVKMYNLHSADIFDIQPAQEPTAHPQSIKAGEYLNAAETFEILLGGPSKMPVGQTHILEEFVRYQGGEGVHNMAFTTDDAIQAVSAMKQRGENFLSFSSDYYATLKANITITSSSANFDLGKIQDLNLLLDFTDDNNYILEASTVFVQDRPTMLCIVQERKGRKTQSIPNGKIIFKAWQGGQSERGNL